MRILFLADNFPPETNAAATRVYERAVYWARWGHEVTVITAWPNFPQGRVYEGYRNRWYAVEIVDGIRVVRVKTFIAPNRGKVLRVLDFLSYLPAAFAASQLQPEADVVAATSPQFFAALAGFLVAAWRRAPFVFELGDIWPASIVGVGAMSRGRAIGLLERIELFLYARAEVVVALTEAFKENLVRRGIPGGKIAVVRNGVDLGRYGPRPRDEALARDWGVEGRFVVGYLGTHGMAHGLRNVLAAAEVLRSREDIRILLVGDGAERRMLAREAARRGLSNVIMQPSQPKSLMPAIWSLCDVALVHLRDAPVFAEVVPSKIFEAMAMGKPLLLSAPDGEARRIIDGDGAGLWVPAENPGRLAQAIEGLCDDAQLRLSFARNSLAAAPRHDRRTQAVEMLQALEIAAARWGGLAAPPATE